MYRWLRGEAGACIDAIEQTLNAFPPQDSASVVLLRQHIRKVLAKSKEFGMPAITSIAQGAMDASPLTIRGNAEALLSLLRKVTRASRKRTTTPQDSDPETGLMHERIFALRLAEIERAGNVHAALGSIRIVDGEALQRRHGDRVALPLVRHVAGILSDQLREDDLVSRTGPFEFGVLLLSEDRGGFQAAMNRVEGAMAGAPFTFPDGTESAIQITSSGRLLGADVRPVARDWAHERSQTIIGTVSGIESRTEAGPARIIGIALRNETTSTVLGSLLERAGFRVVLAGLGASPGRLTPFAKSKVHLLVVDEAQSTLPQLRAVLGRRRTPVVVIAESEEAGQQALAGGAREFVIKPVRTEVLIASIRRLVRRGSHEPAEGGPSAGGIVVASDEVGQLIALGSALQKQGGHFVRLGRGRDDAIAQIQHQVPAVVLLDMSVRRPETRQILQAVAAIKPQPAVVLIAANGDSADAARISSPVIAGVMKRPVELRTLHTEIQRLAGRPLHSDASISQELMRSEILRITRTVPLPRPPR